MSRVFYSILMILCTVYLQAEELKIVSWNLKDFGQSRSDLEIKLIAHEIVHADIIAIQEVVAKHPGGAQAVARLVDQLKRMGNKWDYRISDPTKSSSSHKSERYAFIWNTKKVSITGGRPKLVSSLSTSVEREPFLIQFKTSSREVITILNYHACTHKKHNPERAEIKAISDWLLSQEFQNVVWCGDMNLVIDDVAFRQILSSGYSSVLNGERTSLKKKCKNGNYLSRAEDNILYRVDDFKIIDFDVIDFIASKNCNEVEWKWVSISDHLPIQITIKE